MVVPWAEIPAREWAGVGKPIAAHEFCKRLKCLRGFGIVVIGPGLHREHGDRDRNSKCEGFFARLLHPPALLDSRLHI